MGKFGKRTMNAMQASPRWDASDAPRQSTPAWSDQISERDLKALEKGQLPPWTNMSRSKLLSLAFFVMAMVLGAVAFYAPELARDLRYAGTFRVADDLRATEGRCKRYVFLVSLCSAKIHSVRNARHDDSKEPPCRFDCVNFQFHRARSATFATQSDVNRVRFAQREFFAR